ncbi:MAG: hypothetical protein WD988_01135 [Candidatus Curtissbacteria bacterium]
MYSKARKGTALILWVVVAALIVAVAVAAILMFGKSLGINPLQSSTQTQSVSAVESVGDSDEVVDIQKELNDTSFDEIDKDVEDTASDLKSL